MGLYSYRLPSIHSAIDLDSLHNVSIRGGGPRKNGLSLFVVGIASAVGQTLLHHGLVYGAHSDPDRPPNSPQYFAKIRVHDHDEVLGGICRGVHECNSIDLILIEDKPGTSKKAIRHALEKRTRCGPVPIPAWILPVISGVAWQLRP